MRTGTLNLAYKKRDSEGQPWWTLTNRLGAEHGRQTGSNKQVNLNMTFCEFPGLTIEKREPDEKKERELFKLNKCELK
jgi:hypothetical protein